MSDDLFPISGPKPLETLKKLSLHASHALELGKAAEHLVAADLILQGYRCFLSDQGLPYDLVADLGGRLIRIQCKATCFPRNVSSKIRPNRFAYSWSIRRIGKFGRHRLSNSDCDIVALVALDIRSIAYLPLDRCGQTMQKTPGGTPLYLGKTRSFRGTAAPLSSLTFDLALRQIKK